MVPALTPKTLSLAKAIRDGSCYLDPEDPIVSDFISGFSKKDLSIKYNKSPVAIDSYLNRRRFSGVKIPKEEIEECLKEGLTLTEIGAKFGVGKGRVSLLLKKYNINPEDRYRYQAEGNSGKALSVEEVERLYLKEKWPTLRIAQHFGFSGDYAIRKFMRENNIRIRLDGEHAIKHEDPGKIKELLNNGEWLANKYTNDFISTPLIADELGISPLLVQRALTRHNISRRHPLDYSNNRILGRPHEKLIERLNHLGIEHQTSWIYTGNYGNRTRKFEIDEYLPDHKIFVEVQGKFWHGLIDRAIIYQNVRRKMWCDLIKWLCVTRDYPDHHFLYVGEDDTANFSLDHRLLDPKSGQVDLDPSCDGLVERIARANQGSFKYGSNWEVKYREIRGKKYKIPVWPKVHYLIG